MTEKMEVQEFPLDSVVPNPNQPRKEFDEESLQELARSIASVGFVMEPIIVRPNGADGRYEIVAGERRWRASKTARRPFFGGYWTGMGTIRSIVQEMSDEEMALLTLVENMVRRDLNVAEQGHYLKKLVDSGVVWEKIEARLGLEKKYLEWKIWVVEKCRPEVVWLIKQNTLTGNMGYRLSKLSWNGQLRFLHEVNKQPRTLNEQIGLIDAIWATENQAEMFPEVKLTEEQREATAAFDRALDTAIRAADRLEKMEKQQPGVVGAALATQLDVATEKVGYLIARLSLVQKGLQQMQGKMVVSGKESDG